jgi:hypothetical protein
MPENNVHDTPPTERDDLKHTDTVLTDDSLGTDPAGYEQSINPLGEVPPANDLPDAGDDIPNEGDLVHPAPINAPVGKAPGM